MRRLSVIFLALLLLTGCTKYIPFETVRTEYKDNIKEVNTVDSVVDTRFVYVKGDTVIVYRDREKWRDRFVHDSIYIHKSDSIPYPVERKLSRWEQAKMDLGGIAMGAIAAILCVAVVWLVMKFRK